MKKLLICLLVFTMLLSVCSCDTEKQVIESATELVNEGKYKEAYALLYENRDHEDVKEMLGDFTVVYSKAFSKIYSRYEVYTQYTYNEYGDVTNETKNYYAEIPGMGLVDYVYDYEYTYDSNGNMLTCNLFENGSETPEETTIYTYDSKGNLLKKENTDFGLNDQNGSDYVTCYEYEYDQQGNVLKKTYSICGTVEHVSTYEYDSEGRVIKDFFDTFNEYYNKGKEYVYNADGYLIKESEIRSDYTEFCDYTLNERGDAVKATFSYDYKDETYDDLHDDVLIEYTYSYEYDEKGNKTKYTTVHPDGSTESVEYAYNEQGDIIKETEYSVSGEISETQTQYEYDADGNKVKETVCKNVWRESSVQYEYDDHGNLTKESNGDEYNLYEYTYNEQGLIISKNIDYQEREDKHYQYTYDENKNLIKEIYYVGDDSDDQVVIEYVYDENGNLIKKTDNESGYEKTTEFTYNEHGDILSENTLTYGSTIPVKRYEYKYDASGQMTEKKVISEDNEYFIAYSYDEKGNLKNETYYADEGVKSSAYDYVYDSDNNLIEKTRTVYNGDETSVYPETFTYDELGNLTSHLQSYFEFVRDTYLTEYYDYLYFYTPEK